MVCCVSAQPVNLDLYHVAVQNEVSVNTPHSEFGMVKATGNNYMFTSDRNKFNQRNEPLEEDAFMLYTCDPEASYSTVRPVAVNQKAGRNNGPATPVKNNEFYFTTTNKKATLNWMDATRTYTLTISRATLVDGEWEVEVVKEFKSTKYSFGQPAISKDGKTLFFVSDMEGGEGMSDLYVSYRTENGWTEPENLGPVVNSEGRENHPFIHDSGVLFFASEGHGGFGGLDLFMTYKTEDGWAVPENLGSPINTAADDFSLYLDSDFQNGYFASNREGGMGKDDIYRLSFTSLAEETTPYNASKSGTDVMVTEVGYLSSDDGEAEAANIAANSVDVQR